MRELISDGYGSIEYRYDCKNQILYRRVKFEYQHTQNLGGRFVGEKTLKIVTDSGTECPNVTCYENTWSYNLDEHHECDECPYFNWLASESYSGNAHLWNCDLWNKVWLSNVGLMYPANVGVKYQEDWTVVTEAFNDFTVMPRIGCGICFPYPAASAIRCDQTYDPVFGFGTVNGGGYCLLFDFTPPSEFTWWHCDTEFPIGANEPFYADAPFPPSGVTVRIEPTPNPEEIEDPEQCVPWDDFGDVYISHQISFDKTPKASCDPDQPEAATACAPA
jgi:hypothetical protein